MSALTNSPTADEIIERMVVCNNKRARSLEHYTEQRHYAVAYKGFPHTIVASMEVEATYDAPSSKSFRVLSQTGSKLLVDRVLKKLLESEKEAAKNPAQSAISPQNYVFHLMNKEVSADKQLYVFQVEPQVSHKFLYRGKIWVDGTDYAVARIEVEPAENPSFWIKKTVIRHSYSKTGELWLPKENRSESKVRGGGTAILSIDYGPYRVLLNQ